MSVPSSRVPQNYTFLDQENYEVEMLSHLQPPGYPDLTLVLVAAFSPRDQRAGSHHLIELLCDSCRVSNITVLCSSQMRGRTWFMIHETKELRPPFVMA